MSFLDTVFIKNQYDKIEYDNHLVDINQINRELVVIINFFRLPVVLIKRLELETIPGFSE